MNTSRRTPYGQRRSASADASRSAEMLRLAALGPWERMLLSLELGHRARWMRDDLRVIESAAGRRREPER